MFLRNLGISLSSGTKIWLIWGIRQFKTKIRVANSFKTTPGSSGELFAKLNKFSENGHARHGSGSC